jgi:RNA polymerase sigma-70 factor (ECF subfamily)
VQARDEEKARREHFRGLYDSYSHLILAYALRRSPSPEAAADIVSDVFLVAWRRLDSVPSGGDAKLWLYGVTRRTISNAQRSLRRSTRLHAKLASQVAATAIPHINAPEIGMTREILEAFAELEERDREVLSLAAWEGLEREEIAIVLDCSRALVRMRLHRARGRFQNLLLQRGVLEEQHKPKRYEATGHVAVEWASALQSEEDE